MAAPFPKPVVVHAIRGRVRVRFPDQRGDWPFFKRIVTLLSGHPAIDEVEANPATGSVLVRHSASDEEFRQAAITLGLASEEDFAPSSAAPEAAPGRARPGGAAAAIQPALVAGLGVLQAARGHALGPASEHFFQAASMRSAGLPNAALVLAGLGLLQAARGNLLGSGVSLLCYSLLLGRAQPGGSPPAGSGAVEQAASGAAE